MRHWTYTVTVEICKYELQKLVASGALWRAERTLVSRRQMDDRQLLLEDATNGDADVRYARSRKINCIFECVRVKEEFTRKKRTGI